MTRSWIWLLAATLPAATLLGCKTDADKDGFIASEDCDDDNPEVNPDAVEACDAIDNDCDGEIDEGVKRLYYRDVDGDGYGDLTSEDSFCTQPADYVAVAGDCDDSNAAFNPGAPETDCTDPNDYNCDGSVGYADVDGDGVAACEDCNDGDADIYAGADEVCDGKDNDCDGDIDADAVDGITFYIDHDGDGYGDPSITYSVESCDDAPDGFVDNSDDCNDLAATAFPGAPEVCDDLDNDCNGLTDVDDPGVLDAGFFYPDFDEDGFGDEAAVQLACVDLDGFIEDGGDCDDTRAEVNPDQTEICNNGLDDDCDSVVTCTLDLASADATWTGSDADDKLGSGLGAAGDLNQDGYDDFLIAGEYADADGDGLDEGAVYVVFGPTTGGGSVVSIDSAAIAIAGDEDNDRFGRSASGIGDINNDGVPDFAVGASNHSEHPTLSRSLNGGVWVYYGDADIASSGIDSTDDADIWIYGDRNYDWAGNFLEPAGDINSDGYDDFITGSTGDDDGGAQSGAFYVFYGGASLGSQTGVADADILLYGGSASDRVGAAAAGVGDLDADGFDDIVFGGAYVSTNGSTAGAAYILLGAASGSLNDSLDTATDAVVYGGASQDLAGAEVARAGDVNGDGYADFFVGATGDNTISGSSSGSIYLMYGGTTVASDIDGSDLDTVFDAQIYGGGTDDKVGGAIAGGEDFDGDGNVDVLIGGSAAGSQGAGRAFVLYGPFTGSQNIEDAAIGIFEGVDVDDGAGATVALLGDIDGSGISAIGVGAENANQSATDAGSVYVVLGLSL